MTISQRVKVSQLEEVDLGTENKQRPVNVVKEMPKDEKKAMKELLMYFRDVFAWSYEDIGGVRSPTISTSNSSQHERQTGGTTALPYESELCRKSKGGN